MIKFNEINDWIENISMPNSIDKVVKNEIDIMSRINTEFQKPFIKNLYANPDWQQRVFWAVAGNLVSSYDDLEIDVPLEKITTSINQYALQFDSQPDQRESVKIILTAIKSAPNGEFTPLKVILTTAQDNHISYASTIEIIKQLKRQGDIFEKDECYRSV